MLTAGVAGNLSYYFTSPKKEELSEFHDLNEEI